MDILVEKGKAKELFPDGAPELAPTLLVIRNYEGAVEPGWKWTGTEFMDDYDYAEERRKHYPDPMDYMDAVVKGDQAKIQWYIDECLAVKARFPKPE